MSYEGLTLEMRSSEFFWQIEDKIPHVQNLLAKDVVLIISQSLSQCLYFVCLCQQNTQVLKTSYEVTMATYGSVPQGFTGGTTTNSGSRVSKIAAVATALVATLLIIYGVPAFMASNVLAISTTMVYAHALFEVTSGFMFVFDVGALHNGWNPPAGMETYLADSGGIAYFFWGILLFLKISDPTVLRLNGAFCAVWFVYLGSHLLDIPLRQKSKVPDGSWAMVPVVIKSVCGLASLIAASELEKA